MQVGDLRSNARTHTQKQHFCFPLAHTQHNTTKNMFIVFLLWAKNLALFDISNEFYVKKYQKKAPRYLEVKL